MLPSKIFIDSPMLTQVKKMLKSYDVYSSNTCGKDTVLDRDEGSYLYLWVSIAVKTSGPNVSVSFSVKKLDLKLCLHLIWVVKLLRFNS